MCALHDRAFDRGLLALDDDLRILVSPRVSVSDPPELHRVGLLQIAGRAIDRPDRFQPDPYALRFHRQNVFSG